MSSRLIRNARSIFVASAIARSSSHDHGLPNFPILTRTLPLLVGQTVLVMQAAACLQRIPWLCSAPIFFLCRHVWWTPDVTLISPSKVDVRDDSFCTALKVIVSFALIIIEWDAFLTSSKHLFRGGHIDYHQLYWDYWLLNSGTMRQCA